MRWSIRMEMRRKKKKKKYLAFKASPSDDYEDFSIETLHSSPESLKGLLLKGENVIIIPKQDSKLGKITNKKDMCVNWDEFDSSETENEKDEDEESFACFFFFFSEILR